MESFFGTAWGLATIVGVIILGIVIWWAAQRNKTRTNLERATTEAATRAQYKREDS